MIIADFDYYKTAFYGVLIDDEEQYNRLATRAAVQMDYYTFGKATANADMEAVKMASCAVAEACLSIERASVAASGESGELQSESVGSYSRTYRSSADISAAASAVIKSVLDQYLAGTGLLYRGVAVKCTRHTM